MSTAHTKGRLIVKGRYSVCTEDGETEVANTRWTTLDSSNDEDNARRLVACWNLLDGVPTEKIEQSSDYGSSWGKCGLELAAITVQRDELLEALKLAEAALSDIGDADREPGDYVAWCEARAAEAIPAARAAIAKAEGGAA